LDENTKQYILPTAVLIKHFLAEIYHYKVTLLKYMVDIFEKQKYNQLKLLE